MSNKIIEFQGYYDVPVGVDEICEAKLNQLGLPSDDYTIMDMDMSDGKYSVKLSVEV